MERYVRYTLNKDSEMTCAAHFEADCHATAEKIEKFGEETFNAEFTWEYITKQEYDEDEHEEIRME